MIAGPLGRCRSCNAPIRWVKTRTGASMPLDPDPVAHGNVVIIGYAITVPEAAIVAAGPLAVGEQAVTADRYVSHFSTCPNAGLHRRQPR